MRRLLYMGIAEEEALAMYEAWLLGVPPRRGAVIAAGAILLFTPALPARPVFSVTELPGVYAAISDPLRVRAAARSAREWRRPPAGCAVASAAEGLFLYDADDAPVPEGAQPLLLPDVLAQVGTDREIAEAFGQSVKAVRDDAAAGRFGSGAKQIPAGWLIERRAAGAVYQGGTLSARPLNPLLLAIATAEAAALWGRDTDNARSAAAGAGHRAARLGDGERRRAGRMWLITRAAAEKLYGDPRPEGWRAFAETFRENK